MSGPRRLRTAEAAARLGVKPETLYSYVSRGLLSRERDATGSTFDPAEVERLARSARRAGGVPPTERSLAFVTELTLIEGGSLYYRGVDAVELARTRSFEAVAELLWAGSRSGPAPASHAWPAPGAPLWEAALAAVSALPPRSAALASLTAATVAAGSADPLRHDRTPAGAAAAGRQLLVCMVGALGSGDPGRPVASLLTSALSHRAGRPAEEAARPSAEAVAAVDAALVLMADHEVAASTLAVRVAASFGADPYSAVVAGLGVVGGARHGGVSVDAYRLLREAERRGGAAAVGEHLARGGEVPGFGHALYPDGDPRGAAMLAIARHLPAPAARHDALTSVLSAVGGREVPPPNCDFGLASIAYLLGLTADAGEAVMIVGRTAGWLAHAGEEYSARTSFRVRASYVGPRPGSGR